VPSLAEEVSARFGGNQASQKVGASDVLGNIAQKVRNRFTSQGELLASGGVERHASRAAGSAYEDAIKSGASQEEAIEMAMRAARGIREKVGQFGDAAVRGAEGAGNVMDNLASAGRGAIGLSRAAIGLGSNALDYGGRAASGAGKGMKAIGTAMQPVENYAYIRKALGEYEPKAEEALGFKKRRSWHPPMSQSTMFVGN
jgi:hypothetical protein